MNIKVAAYDMTYLHDNIIHQLRTLDCEALVADRGCYLSIVTLYWFSVSAAKSAALVTLTLYWFVVRLSM